MASFMMTAQSNESNDAVIENIVKEANENSQLEQLGHELMDVIGPRLVGTPQMKQANDWAVKNTILGELLLEMSNGELGVAGREELLI